MDVRERTLDRKSDIEREKEIEKEHGLESEIKRYKESETDTHRERREREIMSMIDS